MNDSDGMEVELAVRAVHQPVHLPISPSEAPDNRVKLTC